MMDFTIDELIGKLVGDDIHVTGDVFVIPNNGICMLSDIRDKSLHHETRKIASMNGVNVPFDEGLKLIQIGISTISNTYVDDHIFYMDIDADSGRGCSVIKEVAGHMYIIVYLGFRSMFIPVQLIRNILEGDNMELTIQLPIVAIVDIDKQRALYSGAISEHPEFFDTINIELTAAQRKHSTGQINAFNMNGISTFEDAVKYMLKSK